MKSLHLARSLMILSVLLPGFPVLAQNKHSEQKFPSLEYERTEVRTLHSDIVGQDFELWISLPRSYSDNESRDYPLIYLMDPYRGFAMVKGLTDLLSAPNQFIQEVIIVGIGYGGKGPEAMMKWALGRTRDLTPVQSEDTEESYRSRLEALGFHDTHIETGGAPLFMDFIKNELITFVESDYRINDNDRIFCGFSFGGLFGLYVLFHAPELFNKYFIGSPSIHYKDEITFTYESNYAGQHTDLKARVFMSAGSLEESTSQHMKKMEELLLSRNYENLELKTAVIDHEGHASSFAAAFNRALIELLGTE